jgi:hypothetical protein
MARPARTELPWVLHCQLGENAGRRTVTKNAQALVQSPTVRRCKETSQAAPARPARNPKRDLLAQLLALNQAVAAKIEKGEPVTAPGVPQNYPDTKKLVTEDCIRAHLLV